MGKSKLQIIASPKLAVLLVASIIAATANSIFYKSALNAFSSKTSDYGFFVSQFTTFLYFIPATAISIAYIWKEPDSFATIWKVRQGAYSYMGLLDSGSSILGTGLMAVQFLYFILNICQWLVFTVLGFYKL